MNELNPINQINDFEMFIRQVEGAEVSNEKKELGLGCRYKHTFADGCYIREMFIPKGLIIISEIHKTKHPFFILSGDVTVRSSNGDLDRYKAPFSGITMPYTKRALYTNEDTVWTTIHVTNETDIEKIGEEILAKSFDEQIESEETKEIL